MFNLFKRKKIIDLSSKELVCQAPFKSLRFEHSGKFIASCFNRGYILGEFPKDSIESVWNGTKLSELRNSLSKNDFSKGCQSCGKSIISGFKSLSGSYQYEYLKSLKNDLNYPVMFDFEIGSTCNFECIMCSGEYSTSIRKNREGKSPYESPFEDNIELLVEQLKPFLPHLKEMRFLGGEPFLMKSLYKIWDSSIKINPSIQLNVLTNASILNDRIKKLLEKGNFKVSISLDSIKKNTYELIRKNGDFTKVMENTNYFIKLNSQKGFITNFNLCVMRQNWEEIPSYFDYCNENRIEIILHTVKFPLHCSIWNLDYNDLNNILKQYEKINLNHQQSDSVIIKNNECFTSLVNQIRIWMEESLKREINKKKSTSNELQYFSEKFSKIDNLESTNNYMEFMLDVLNEFSEQDKTTILHYLNDLDINLIINEINISDKSRIYERLKFILLNH